ncbi:unnamed protein product [Durusdinium trenchii]|uniref:Uncharacterized protein n=2 Tax=Durusdinium trenchii TaxID=1381693 RepID=A0ABP0IXV4_9DINO
MDVAMAMSARFAMTIMKSLLAKHIGPLKEFVQATSVLLIRSSSLTCLRSRSLRPTSV